MKRPRPLTVVAVLVLVAGSVVRALYALTWHRMMDHVYSDMALYWRFAGYTIDPAHKGGIEDTLYPPGAPLFFGYLSKLDATMRVATYVQLAMALAIPVLVFAIGRELYERRVGLVAMMLASLYFPLFEYSGYLLAENPFTFFLLLAFYLIARSLRPAGRRVPFALAAGVTLGVAVAFKSAALMSALLVVLVLLGRWRWGGLRVWRTLVPAGLGLALVLAPLAVRATRLNEGRFCLVANEASRGILLGHHGDVFIAKFTDHKRGYYYEFGYSTAHERHRNGVVTLEYGPWDNKEVVAEAWAWTKAHPKESLALGFEHVFDLFISMPWPSGDDEKLRFFTFCTQRGYQVVLLLPAALALVIILWPWRKSRPGLGADFLVLAPIAGICASAFLAVGEARYRAPFDGFLILLAARGYLAIWDGAASRIAAWRRRPRPGPLTSARR